MDKENYASLDELLARVRNLSATQTDYFSSETSAIQRIVSDLTVTAYYFNYVAVQHFGGRLGPVRDRGLVEQVVASAFQTFGDTEPHPTPFEKAAVLLRGITQGHPFVDGNKRTGYLLASYYLRRMGHRKPATQIVDSEEALCFAISSGDIRDIQTIEEALRGLWSIH